MNAVELAAKLRKVADAIETLGEDHEETLFVNVFVSEQSTLRLVAPALVPFKKILGDYSYRVETEDKTLSLLIDRSRVCRKVKVLQEVEQWQCEDSILEPTCDDTELDSVPS